MSFDATVDAEVYDFAFVRYMSNKIRNGWGRVKKFFDPTVVREVTEDSTTVTTRQGFLWLIYQITKVPHWLGIGVELLVRGVVNLTTAVVVVIGMTLSLIVMAVWGIYNALAFIVLMLAFLLGTILSTPYEAMSGGRDAIKADWWNLKQRFLRPFRRLQASFRIEDEPVFEEEDLFIKESMNIMHSPQDEGFSDLAPEDTGIPSRKAQTPPKGRPTPARSTPARKTAHQQVQAHLKNGDDTT